MICRDSLLLRYIKDSDGQSSTFISQSSISMRKKQLHLRLLIQPFDGRGTLTSSVFVNPSDGFGILFEGACDAFFPSDCD